MPPLSHPHPRPCLGLPLALFASLLCTARAQGGTPACDSPCAASTCGALRTSLTCTHFDTLGCDCAGCCDDTITTPPAPPPAPPNPTPFSDLPVLSPEDIDAAIAAGTPLQLPQGATLRLTETVVLSGVNLTVAGDGDGATLAAPAFGRLFEVTDGGHLELHALRLVGGNASAASSASGLADGGAALVTGSGSTLKMYDVQVADSVALDPDASGGGVAAVAGGALEMANCEVIDCRCAGLGGGVFAGGAAHMSMLACSVARCDAFMGGGVLATACSASLVEVEAVNCTAVNGGGFYAFTGSVLRLEGCVARRCASAGFYGGIAHTAALSEVIASSFVECSAVNAPGGSLAFHSSTSTFVNVTVERGFGAAAACCFMFAGAEVDMFNVLWVDCYNTGSNLFFIGSASTLRLTGCTCQGLRVDQDCAGIFVNGRAELTDCHMIDSESVGNAGAIHVSGTTASLRMVRGSIVGCRAGNNGGALRASSGKVELVGVLVERCSTLGLGGAITIDGGGHIDMSADGETRCVVRDCSAVSVGAGLLVQDGSMTVSGTDVVRCSLSNQENSYGGGFGLLTGSAELRDMRIMGCEVSVGGGGVWVLGPAQLTIEDIEISDCRAVSTDVSAPLLGGRGGGVSIFGGTLTAHRVTIRDCFAAVIGGGLSVEAATVNTVTESQIIGCTAPTGAAVHMSETLIEGIETRLHAAYLTVTPNCGTEPLLRSTRLPLIFPGFELEELDPAECPDGVSPYDRLFSEGTRLALCDDSTEEMPVCGPAATCAEVERGPTSTLVPQCSCEPPSYPVPDTELTPEVVPSSLEFGCLTPRRGSAVSLLEGVAESVVLRLEKTAAGAVTEDRSLSVEISGTDTAGGTWSVDPDSVPFWIKFPVSSGRFGEEDDSVVLVMSVSISGLRENAEPYTANVNLTVVSQQTTVFSVPVVLFVTASISANTSAWGEPSDGPDGRCTPKAAAEPEQLMVGKRSQVIFTACDSESLPVAHGLPSLTDQRSWKAVLTDDDTGQEHPGLQVQFEEGKHYVELTPDLIGDFTLRLQLDDEPVDEELPLDVGCPEDAVPNDDRECVCKAGYEPDGDGGCQQCPVGKKKDTASNDPCETDNVPLIVGLTVGLGMLLIFAAVALWWRWREGKRKVAAEKLAFERERKFERDFMALACHEVRNPLNGTASYLQFTRAMLLDSINPPQPPPPAPAAAARTVSNANPTPTSTSNPTSNPTPTPIPTSTPTSMNPEVELMVTGALTCTSVALRVLENMSSLEKLKAGLLNLKEDFEPLTEVMKEVHTILQPQAQLKGEAQLRAKLEPALKDAQIYCDRKILVQVLVNLGQNAVRFTNKGFVEISAWREREEPLRGLERPPKDKDQDKDKDKKVNDQEVPSSTESTVTTLRAGGSANPVDGTPPRCRIHFAVRDTGEGIAPEAQKLVFNRYETTGGTGLGLYLTKLQLQQMGSEIQLRSPWREGDTGAEFSFTVETPVSNINEDAEDTEPTLVTAPPPTELPPAAAVETQTRPAPAPPKTLDGTQLFRDGLAVLLADDEATNTAVLKRALLSFMNPTWVVTRLASAEEAVQEFKAEVFDLVIIDEHFGKPEAMLGSAAVRSMREVEASPEAPKTRTDPQDKTSPARPAVVISCTGNAAQEHDALVEAGATGVWNKPFPGFCLPGASKGPSDMHVSLVKLFGKQDRLDMLAPAGMEMLKGLNADTQ